MSAIELLKELVKASERAANIARLCRKDEHLFGLLIQEKPREEANTRFEHDFKTLADCLIQEAVRHNIGQKFPELRDSIRGEENPSFTNASGESIVVAVGEDKDETIESIQKILNGDRVAAERLVEEVYKDIEIDLDKWQIPDESIALDNELVDLGIWIDPIDGTAEYIKAQEKPTKYPNIMASGLKCVTVLIGVYEIPRGTPIIGVVNQPFANEVDAGEYEGKIFWGLTVGDLKFNNIAPVETEDRIALLSPSEQSKYVEFLKNQLKYDIVYSSGAGHKILKVATGEAELFLLSKGNTYKWDTCAPQAILRSLDGELFDLQDTLINKSLKKISYHNRTVIRNMGGLIAYRNIEKFKDFLKFDVFRTVAKASKPGKPKPKTMAKKEPLILSNRPNKRTPPEAPKERNEKGIIYVKHLPHGFFETQLRQFFGQFGEVTRVHVARSKRTLRSRGYAYVEFRFREVAQIASETMNNYLMFGKILKTGILPAGAKRIPARYEMAYDAEGNKTSSYKLWLKRMVAKSNGRVTKTKVVKRNKRSLAKLKQMKKRFGELGVDFDVDQIAPDYSSEDLTLPPVDEEEAKIQAAKEKRKARKQKVDKLEISIDSTKTEEKADVSQDSVDNDDDTDEDASFLPLESTDWDVPGSTDSSDDENLDQEPSKKKLTLKPTAASQKLKSQAVEFATKMKQQIDSDKKKGQGKATTGPGKKSAAGAKRPLVLRPPSTSADESSPEKPVAKGKKQKVPAKAKLQSSAKVPDAKEKKLIGGGVVKKGKDKKKLQKAPEASSTLKSVAKSMMKDPNVKKVKSKDIGKKKRK
ncbi:uncharacterized protein LOC129741572 [Uranotaenia lowii]|uniref:uncharacterized protein LOC129741572 n=1 Tax=Uranotaenia lowii TaxID=190385 RepID=UPI0024788AAD|nr:uncharacterized protein LOC129741572 [Uranotaenia lowii]